MPIMRPSMSISTQRAWPSFGSHSAYGKLVPIMNRQSQPSIISYEGFEPSSPMGPVTNGRSSGSDVRPSSAFATPAPSTSAASTTSSAASRAPWPIRIATFSEELRISAARSRSDSCGRIRGFE
jgi:hypothetical protein